MMVATVKTVARLRLTSFTSRALTQVQQNQATAELAGQVQGLVQVLAPHVTFAVSLTRLKWLAVIPDLVVTLCHALCMVAVDRGPAPVVTPHLWCSVAMANFA